MWCFIMRLTVAVVTSDGGKPHCRHEGIYVVNKTFPLTLDDTMCLSPT